MVVAVSTKTGTVQKQLGSAPQLSGRQNQLKYIRLRLDLMYFGAGLADENIQLLENDPGARLINKQLKEVR